MTISGPAAGNVHRRTNADPTGTTVKGMLNNCGDGYKPWGTILTAEENFDQYFANRTPLDPAGDPIKQYAKDNASVFGIPACNSGRGWETVDDRFDMTKEWNEPFRYGWIVEADPYDPTAAPAKRTALGRFKHEAASGAYDDSGRWVIDMGDDQAGQYIYKFVTDGVVNTADRAANADLLDSGTLHVATFNADGTGTWKPLVFGSVPNPPSPALPFEDQADILIRCRTAASQLGATPMDRPEDIDVHPVSGYAYIAMTGTSRSTADAANPRTSSPATDPNSSRAGHVIELRETASQAGTSFNWEIFLLCGVPNVGGTLDAATVPAAANTSGRTYYPGFDESQVSPITRPDIRPDNVAFDALGHLFITTDGQPSGLVAAGSACTARSTPSPPSAPSAVTPHGSISVPQCTWNAVVPASGGCLRPQRRHRGAAPHRLAGGLRRPRAPARDPRVRLGGRRRGGCRRCVVGGMILLRNRRAGNGPAPA